MSDIATLRRVLIYARRLGWEHWIHGAFPDYEHVWRRGKVYVSLVGDELEIRRPGARRSLWCPRDIPEVVRVLIAAELLPANFNDPPCCGWCVCGVYREIGWPHTHEVERRELVVTR